MKRYLVALFLCSCYSVFSQSLMDKEKAKQLIVKAEHALQKQSYDSALVYYNTADSLSSAVFTASDYNNMAGVYYMTKKFDKALNICKKAIKLDTNNSETYYNLGLSYLAMDSNRQAIDIYKKLVALDSTNFQVYFNLASSYCNVKEYERAIECYQQMININPNDSKVYVNMAIAYAEAGNSDKLFEYMKKAAQMGDKEAQEFLSKKESKR